MPITDIKVLPHKTEKGKVVLDFGIWPTKNMKTCLIKLYNKMSPYEKSMYILGKIPIA